MEPPSSLALATPRGGRPLTDRPSRSVAGSWVGALLALRVTPGAMDRWYA